LFSDDLKLDILRYEDVIQFLKRVTLFTPKWYAPLEIEITAICNIEAR
jgi:hypothetical protein